MIKTILFDLGNVILPVDGMRLAKRLTHYSSLSADQILEAFFTYQLVENFETGKITPYEFFLQISDACALKNLSFDEFTEMFNGIFEEDQRVVHLILNLKKKYKVGLISNTNALHMRYIKSKYPIMDQFDRMVFSHEAGVRKPDPAIYKLALNELSAEPSQTIFIDDLPNNIASAQELGIKAIHYKGFEQLTQDLLALGVTI